MQRENIFHSHINASNSFLIRHVQTKIALHNTFNANNSTPSVYLFIQTRSILRTCYLFWCIHNLSLCNQRYICNDHDCKWRAHHTSHTCQLLNKIFKEKTKFISHIEPMTEAQFAYNFEMPIKRLCLEFLAKSKNAWPHIWYHWITKPATIECLVLQNVLTNLLGLACMALKFVVVRRLNWIFRNNLLMATSNRAVLFTMLRRVCAQHDNCVKTIVCRVACDSMIIQSGVCAILPLLDHVAILLNICFGSSNF